MRSRSDSKLRAILVDYFTSKPTSEWALDKIEIHLQQFPSFKWEKSHITNAWLDQLKNVKNETQKGPKLKAAKHLLDQHKKIKVKKQQKHIYHGCNVVANQGIIGVVNNSFPQTSKVVQEEELPNVPHGSPPVETITAESNTKFPISTWKSVASVTPAFLGFLQHSIIDLRSLARIDRDSAESLLSAMLKLPPDNFNLEFSLRRFKSCKDRNDFIKTTETCPRPPRQPINETTFICTWSNRAVSHWLSHCQRIPSVMPLLKEGNYDIIWSNLIDDLWSDEQQAVVIIRKEILSYVGGQQRFDGVFRYHDGGTSFDIGVTEASTPASNPNNDAKGDNDLSKVYLTMIEMLRDLRERVRGNEECVKKLQVFGMVTSGLSLRIYRMQWADQYYCVVKSSNPYIIPLVLVKVEDLFNIFRVLAKIQVAMIETVDLVLRGGRDTVSF